MPKQERDNSINTFLYFLCRSNLNTVKGQAQRSMKSSCLGSAIVSKPNSVSSSGKCGQPPG